LGNRKCEKLERERKKIVSAEKAPSDPQRGSEASQIKSAQWGAPSPPPLKPTYVRARPARAAPRRRHAIIELHALSKQQLAHANKIYHQQLAAYDVMVDGAWPCSYSGAVERACLRNGWLRFGRRL
jgi:hypothetical protein